MTIIDFTSKSVKVKWQSRKGSAIERTVKAFIPSCSALSSIPGIISENFCPCTYNMGFLFCFVFFRTVGLGLWKPERWRQEFTDFHMPFNTRGMDGKMSLGRNRKYISVFPKFPVTIYMRRCITHARSGILCQYEFFESAAPTSVINTYWMCTRSPAVIAQILLLPSAGKKTWDFLKIYFIFITFSLLVVSVHTCACVLMPWHICGDERKTCKNHFSMSTMEVKFRSLGLVPTQSSWWPQDSLN